MVPHRTEIEPTSLQAEIPLEMTFMPDYTILYISSRQPMHYNAYLDTAHCNTTIQHKLLFCAPDLIRSKSLNIEYLSTDTES